MSIYEYDAKKQRKFDREEGREEGRKEGLQEHLIGQVCRKLKKGMPIDRIAAELEEDEDRIRAIVNVAEKYAPDYDIEKIVENVRFS